MFPFRTKPPARTAVGWEHLMIRPDTKLTAADKRRVEKAIRRAKKEGKIAKTAQQTIPYEEMYPDGICRITNRLYSKSVLCDDINYAEASDDEKAVLFELYCKLVNYFGPSVGFELSVICYPADLVEYRKMLALNPQGDQFDEIRKEYSDMLVRQVSKSRYERRICLTYTIEADGMPKIRNWKNWLHPALRCRSRPNRQHLCSPNRLKQKITALLLPIWEWAARKQSIRRMWLLSGC